MNINVIVVYILTLLLTITNVGYEAAVLKWSESTVIESNQVQDKLRYNAQGQTQFHKDKTLGIQVKCDVCKAVVIVIQTLVKANKSKDEIASAVARVCIDLDIEDKRVCDGLTNVFKVS